MKFRLFLKKYYFTIQFTTIFLTFLLFMNIFYFDDRTFSVKDIPIYLNDFLFYWSVILSMGTPLITCYLIGAFNSENIKRIKSMDEDEIRRNLKQEPYFQFNSKKVYYIFMLFNIPLHIFLVVYLLYYELLPYIFGDDTIVNNDIFFYSCLTLGCIYSLGLHYYLRLFHVNEILANIKKGKTKKGG